MRVSEFSRKAISHVGTVVLFYYYVKLLADTERKTKTRQHTYAFRLRSFEVETSSAYIYTHTKRLCVLRVPVPLLDCAPKDGMSLLSQTA